MGGIRVSKSRDLIVLISNNTDPTYRNEWTDGTLQFVGIGSTGPQKLDRQNKTLASSKRNGMAVHLFEVFEKSKYVYAGEVELADEPYLSDQRDATGASRLVWMFPLRRKVTDTAETRTNGGSPKIYLPHGAYAVIEGNLTDKQVDLVHEALDRLKGAGVVTVDQRDVDLARYEKALAAWHARVLDRVRGSIKALIAKRKRAAKERNQEFRLIDDELKINSASDETELRAALVFLDRDDTTSANQIFDEAMSRETMPEPPKWLKQSSDPTDIALVRPSAIDQTKLKDFC
ncbi:hypothetical protein [Bradyrhizobium sp. McL0615]|uniref:hypothetical protein n=1 Tax=Bradyrhizobium sp. McL0615 TaxID=3415673 RepID=UPI003CF235F7